MNCTRGQECIVQGGEGWTRTRQGVHRVLVERMDIGDCKCFIKTHVVNLRADAWLARLPDGVRAGPTMESMAVRRFGNNGVRIIRLLFMFVFCLLYISNTIFLEIQKSNYMVT